MGTASSTGAALKTLTLTLFKMVTGVGRHIRSLVTLTAGTGLLVRGCGWEGGWTMAAALLRVHLAPCCAGPYAGPAAPYYPPKPCRVCCVASPVHSRPSRYKPPAFP